MSRRSSKSSNVVKPTQQQKDADRYNRSPKHWTHRGRQGRQGAGSQSPERVPSEKPKPRKSAPIVPRVANVPLKRNVSVRFPCM